MQHKGIGIGLWHRGMRRAMQRRGMHRGVRMLGSVRGCTLSLTLLGMGRAHAGQCAKLCMANNLAWYLMSVKACVMTCMWTRCGAVQVCSWPCQGAVLVCQDMGSLAMVHFPQGSNTHIPDVLYLFSSPVIPEQHRD